MWLRRWLSAPPRWWDYVFVAAAGLLAGWALFSPRASRELPATVYLGGHAVSVRSVEGFDDEDQVGEMDAFHDVLTILSRGAPHFRRETLCHEIVEYWDTAHGLRLKHRQIEELGVLLHQFLRDNEAGWAR